MSFHSESSLLEAPQGLILKNSDFCAKAHKLDQKYVISCIRALFFSFCTNSRIPADNKDHHAITQTYWPSGTEHGRHHLWLWYLHRTSTWMKIVLISEVLFFLWCCNEVGHPTFQRSKRRTDWRTIFLMSKPTPETHPGGKTRYVYVSIKKSSSEGGVDL